jgi:hypothetical protein
MTIMVTEVYQRWAAMLVELVEHEQFTGISEALVEDAVESDPMLRAAVVQVLIDQTQE